MLQKFRKFGLAAIGLILVLSGCSSPQIKMDPVEKVTSFTLPETYAKRTGYKNGLGFNETFFVVGLFKGQYVAVGHDKDGVYYRGPENCFIYWLPAIGDKFLATGVPPTQQEKIAVMGAIADISQGGVWVPYDTSKNKVRYFYYQDFRLSTLDTESRIPPSPSTTAPMTLAQTTNSVLDAEAVDRKLQDDFFSNSYALNAAQASTGSPENYMENGVSSAVGVGVGQVIGRAGLRGMQGNLMLGPEITDERILDAIKPTPVN